MTDDEREQLLSDIVDGVATPEDVARVEGDPALRAELAALRDAVDRLHSPVASPSEAQREAMIEAALTAFDDAAVVADAVAPGTAPVAELASRRAKHTRRLNLVGAAAAVVLVVGAAAFVLNRGGDDADSTSADTFAGAAESADAMDEEESAEMMAEDGEAADESLTATAAVPQAASQGGDALADQDDAAVEERVGLDDELQAEVEEGEATEEVESGPLPPIVEGPGREVIDRLAGFCAEPLEFLVPDLFLVIDAELNGDLAVLELTPDALDGEDQPLFEPGQDPIVAIDLTTCEFAIGSTVVPVTPG